MDVRVPNVLNKLLRLRNLTLPFYSDDGVGNYALKLDEGLDELETLSWFDSSMQKVLTCPRLRELTIYVEIGKQLNECRDSVIVSTIVVLTLMNCEIEDNPMEILGKFPVLRKLDLLHRSFVGVELMCPALSFSNLMQLELKELPELREWRVKEGAMPRLSQIKIKDCPDLMMLPDGLRFISSLQTLEITNMPSLGKRVLASEDDGGGGGEDFDKVRHVPSIIISN